MSAKNRGKKCFIRVSVCRKEREKREDERERVKEMGEARWWGVGT